jgi:hypothetical protein
MHSVVATQSNLVRVILLALFEALLTVLKKTDGLIVLVPVVLKRQSKAFAVTVKFHRPALVSQKPIWPGLGKWKPEHLLKDVPADPFAVSSSAYRAPMTCSHVVRNS